MDEPVERALVNRSDPCSNVHSSNGRFEVTGGRIALVSLRERL